MYSNMVVVLQCPLRNKLQATTEHRIIVAVSIYSVVRIVKLRSNPGIANMYGSTGPLPPQPDTNSTSDDNRRAKMDWPVGYIMIQELFNN